MQKKSDLERGLAAALFNQLDFWILSFWKAYSDLRDIVGNLDLWIMAYIELGPQDLDRCHQY